jgi:hypothetical protein
MRSPRTCGPRSIFFAASVVLLLAACTNVARALLGAVAGLLLAQLLLRLFAVVALAAFHLERVHTDESVPAFALCVAIVTAVVFGLYPALRRSETGTSLALRQGGRGTVGRGGARV